MTPAQWLIAIPACLLAAAVIAFGCLILINLIFGDDLPEDTYADYCNEQDEMK